jgi:GH15 family glucan-1,4-alpha-glucosidase
MAEYVGSSSIAGYLPIEDHGMIGDLHTVALVGVNGDIDWCCLPRFDSPSVFGALLDTQRAGRFTLTSRDAVRTKQMYHPDTNVLLTRFLGADSVAEVVDFMVPRDGAGGSGAGHLVRRLRAARGRVTGRVRCAPAFDYGRVPHEVRLVDGVGAMFSSPAGRLVLRSTTPLRVDGDAVAAEPVLEEGESIELVLSWDGEVVPLRPEQVADWLAATETYWRRWIAGSRYTGRYREMVERSALVLKMLVHDPTGALVAAPTTSLPESIGGGRNWDYRYTWIRDAAFTLYALMRLGFTGEAAGFMDWLENRCHDAVDGDGLQVVYGVDGRRELPEQVLDHLAGYAGSKPVRIGNAATRQRQLDIYGELMDSVYLFNKYGEPISYDLWEALRRQLDWLADHWEEPDQGLWEMRGPPRRHTYSALMTWVAFERAQRIALQRGLPAPIDTWRALADRAYLYVQDHGWNPDAQAFVQHPGTTTLDASALIMPLVKFVGPADPRFLSTLNRIERELVTDSLVRRYNTDGSDGLTGGEGTFSLCSFWYVEALTRAGRLSQARHMFEQMLTYANHLGLYAEEVGPAGEALGNFPQAFTHLALISSAVNLDRALNRSKGR